MTCSIAKAVAFRFCVSVVLALPFGATPLPAAAQAHGEFGMRAPGSSPVAGEAPRVSASLPTLQTIANEGWAARTAMPSARWGHGIVTNLVGEYPDNEAFVYVISGADGSFANTSAVSRYDVGLDEWTAMAPMTPARVQLSAARVGGKIYVPGGYGGSFSPVTTLNIYDIETNVWSTGAPLLRATGDYAIGTYADRYIYVIGGYSGSGDLNDVQIYDTLQDTWANGTPRIGPAVAGLRGAIVGNRIIVVGGFSQALAATQATVVLGTIDPADPTTIVWSAAPDYPGGPAGRLGAGTLLSAGPARGTSVMNIAVFTGGDPTGQGIAAKNDTWVYDFDTGTWDDAPVKPTGVSNISNLAGVAYGGKLHIMSTGGYTGVAVTAANEWLTLGDEPVSDLSLTMSAAASVAPGDSLVYTLAYASTGDSATSDVVLSEVIPYGTLFDAAASSVGWICAPDDKDGSLCQFELGDLASGASGSVEFAVQTIFPVPDGLTGIVNEASISGAWVDPDPANDSASVTTPFSAGSVALTPVDSTSGEDGATASYQLVLQVRPTGDVTIAVASDDLTEGTTATSQVVFTPADWDEPRTVTIDGVDDLLEDGDVGYSVTNTVVAGSGNYDGVAIAAFSAINVDDEIAGAPASTGLDSVRDTGDGELEQNETTIASITQLVFGFSEPLSPTSLDPVHFRLVEAGADGATQTAGCDGAVAADDVPVALQQVVFTDVSQSRAAVTLDSGYALPVGTYRAFACDTLTDRSGNPPDASFVRDFAIAASNVAVNPNFDRDLAGWTLTPASEIDWTGEDAEQATTSGAARIATPDGAALPYHLEQCIETGFDTAAAAVRIDSATQGTPSARIEVDYFAEPGCAGAPIANLASPPAQGDTGGDWVVIGVGSPAPQPVFLSTRLRLSVSAFVPPAIFAVEFDNVEALQLPAMFSDGFEGDAPVP